MNKPYTVIGYQWQKNDQYGNNEKYSGEPLTYRVRAEDSDSAGSIAEDAHEDEFFEKREPCRNFRPTLVVEGHPEVTRLW